MTLLDEALARVDEEFYIFPLLPDSKKPAVNDWENWATINKNKIEEYWTDYPNSNIGIACGPSGVVVLDIDNKGDKKGSDTLITLGIKENPTFTVETPTGGFHKYYESNGSNLRNTVAKLGEGLDTRAKGGYVVAEGSRIKGKPYVFVGGDSPIKLPQWIIEGTKSKAKILQTDEKSATAIDLQRAVDWLMNEAPETVVMGYGSDKITYDVACQLRDFGLNEKQTFTLMETIYNPRCVPNWPLEKLKIKIDNAFNYAQNSKGAKSFEGMFEDLTKKINGLHPVKASDISLLLPPRDWVLGHRLITGYVTVTVSPGGVGKSMYTMVEALAVATGRPLLGDTPRKVGPVVIYNTEDPLDEIQRRILAIALQYDIPLNELNNVYLLSGIDEPLRLARTIQGMTQVTEDNVKLTRLVEKTKAVLLVVDPFIRTHAVQENDNNAIDTVVQCFSRLANACKCSVSIVHHTRKLPAGTGAGDMDIARGASSLVSAARIATTLTVMGEREAKSLQIPAHERYWYIRTDNAKGNMSAPAKHASWYRKISVKLPNGDSVGTLEPVDLAAQYTDKQLAAQMEAENLAKELYGALGLGEFKLSEAVKIMSKIDFSGEAPATLRRKLTEMYEYSVESGDIKVVHLFREKGTPKHVIEISLI